MGSTYFVARTHALSFTRRYDIWRDLYIYFVKKCSLSTMDNVYQGLSIQRFFFVTRSGSPRSSAVPQFRTTPALPVEHLHHQAATALPISDERRELPCFRPVATRDDTVLCLFFHGYHDEAISFFCPNSTNDIELR